MGEAAWNFGSRKVGMADGGSFVDRERPPLYLAAVGWE